MKNMTSSLKILVLSLVIASGLPALATCYESQESKLSFDDKDHGDVRVLLNWSEQDHAGQIIMARRSTDTAAVAGIYCDNTSVCQIDDDGGGENQTRLVFSSSVGHDEVSLQMAKGELFATKYEFDSSVRFVAVGEADEDHKIEMKKVDAAQCAPYAAMMNEGDGPDSKDKADFGGEGDQDEQGTGTGAQSTQPQSADVSG